MRRVALIAPIVLAFAVVSAWAGYELTTDDSGTKVPSSSSAEGNQCPFQGREKLKRVDSRCMEPRIEVGEAVCTSLTVTKIARRSIALDMTAFAFNADMKSFDYIVWNTSLPWRITTRQVSLVDPKVKKTEVQLALSPGLYLILANVSDIGRKVTPPCVATFSVQ